MPIVHPGTIVKPKSPSLGRSQAADSYRAVKVILHVLDILMGGIFALDVYRDGHPVNTCDVHNGPVTHSPLDLRPRAQVEYFRDAEVANRL